MPRENGSKTESVHTFTLFSGEAGENFLCLRGWRPYRPKKCSESVFFGPATPLIPKRKVPVALARIFSRIDIQMKVTSADFPFFYAKIGRHCDFMGFFSSSLIGAGLESWGRDIRNVAQASRRAADEGVLLQRHKSSGFPSGPKAHLPRNWTLRIQVRISLYVLQGNIWNSHGLTCASMTKPTTNSWVMGNFITLSDNNCFKVFIFYSPSGQLIDITYRQVMGI